MYMYAKHGFFSETQSTKVPAAIAQPASCCFAIVMVSLILLSSVRESFQSGSGQPIRGNHLLDRPCDEIYVVGEGETLHTISGKCDDPFIVERNPHIQDSDVFPGLVIKITPSKPWNRRLLQL
ncbi:hypothetical protein NMG60_11012320 [Bertholletia excelsa]